MRALLFASLLLLSVPAGAEPAYRTRAIVMPGSGYLVADGTSVVTLEVIIEIKKGATPPKKADVTAEAGEVLASRFAAPGRLLVFYKMPPKKAAGRIGLTIKLQTPSGGEVEEIFSMTIEEPKAPSLSLTVTPEVVSASGTAEIKVAATAKGVNLEGLRINADRGDLEPSEATGDTSLLFRETTLTAKNFPPDAPSYLLLLAATSSLRGYTGATDGVSVKAPIRISVEIPPGTELAVEGAESPMPPVPAPADGKTVMEDVEVRYGARLRAFQKKGRSKSEISVVIPTGQVPAGLAIGIPGQTSADSGIGPSIMVAIPPSPVGGKPFWPDITVEGAPILATESISERVKVLTIKRPGEPKDLKVLLDDQLAGTISFDAARGTVLDAKAVPLERDERGAALISIKDSQGSYSDFPEPRVHLQPGGEAKIKRVSVGRYRVSLPPSTPGATGSKVKVQAEIPPPPVIAGDPLEFIDDQVELKLSGPPPALRTNEPPPPPDQPPPPGTGGSVTKPPPPVGPVRTVGLSAYLLGGRSFSRFLSFGVGIGVDYRPALLDRRLSFRGGLEFARGSASGQVALDGQGQAETTASIGGLMIPIDGAFVLVGSSDFELLALLGFALRFEQGALEVGGDSAGGGSRVGFGLRGGLEGGLHVGPGTLLLRVLLEGLATSAKGLGPADGFDESLTSLRAELGFRWWF